MKEFVLPEEEKQRIRIVEDASRKSLRVDVSVHLDKGLESCRQRRV